MSDCDKCWSTPCECGHDYRNWNTGRLQNLINILTLIKKNKLSQAEKEPVVFRDNGDDINKRFKEMLEAENDLLDKKFP